MELKAHFNNIHKVIIDHLGKAQFEIVAAIAWFTDRDIYDVLCKKAASGIKVSLALMGDEINKGPGGLNFHKLSALGGQVTFLPPSSRETPTMHHKFCVIDGNSVITGSYNWSRKARSNDENITVVTEAPDFARKYLDTFNNVLVRAGKGVPVTADADAARRRLDMVRNLILLGEQDDIEPQLRKLRPVAVELELERIIAALDNGEYKSALEQIEDYMRRKTALVVAGFADIPRLRFQLEALELRLESLTDEKADLERRLITFNRRHDEALGDLIQQVLKARAELARRQAALPKKDQDREEAEAAAREAEEAYREYSSQHEELKREQPLPKLDEAVERELKSLYRKACSLCHPDKVPGDKKAAAHLVFTELQEAYKRNDLARVREIQATLAAGGIHETRSSTLSQVESLKAAIAELEYAIGKLLAELKALQASEGHRLLDLAGDNESDWMQFFERQRKVLEGEMTRVDAEIKAMNSNEG